MSQESDAWIRIAVIVPAFNEEQVLAKTINSMPRSIAEGNEVEVIVIDDGSTDRTCDIARSNGADIVVKHKSNLGLAKALKSGLQAAIAADADIIAIVDADGQFNPKELPNIVLPIVEGSADVVLGSRFEEYETAKRIPLSKRLGNQLITLIVSLATGKIFSDTQCGFRALSRKAAMELDIKGFFTYTQEMIIGLYAKHFKFTQVPVSVKYFRGRDSRIVKCLPVYAVKAIALILLAVLSVHKIRIALILLSLISAIALLGLSFVIFA